MAVVTLFAVALAAAKTLGFEFIPGFSGLAWSFGFVVLLALTMIPLDWAISRLPYWTLFIFIPILYFGLGFAFFLFGEAIDQPHLAYLDGSNWLTHGVSFFFHLEMIATVVVGMLIVIAFDAALQRNRPRDGAYYPRLANVWRNLGLFHVRLILIIGGLLVVGYYATTVVEVWSAQQRPVGWVWPPKRVFAACQILWGLLWLADCASRPNRGTMAAAIGYLCMTLLLLPQDGVVRE